MSLIIVAEIGSNWWRPDPEQAKESAFEHIRIAAECGATAVKFQLFRADTLYSLKRAPEQWKQTHKFELNPGWLFSLKRMAHQFDLEFWITPFSPELARQAVLFADVIKIASGDLVYEELADVVSMFPKVALSTGGANGDEVLEALSLYTGRRILMYCVSNYPASPGDYHLHQFPYSDLADEIGVSDHTLDGNLLLSAIEAGYTVFEKHFRLQGTPQESPDYVVSMTPPEFTSYCQKANVFFEKRYRSGFGNRTDTEERFWARRGPDGLRPAGVGEVTTPPAKARGLLRIEYRC